MKKERKRKKKYYVPMVHDSKLTARLRRKDHGTTYCREDPKRLVKGTPFYLVKHGHRKLIINRHSGEVVVKRRRDDKVMVNSKYAKH